MTYPTSSAYCPRWTEGWQYAMNDWQYKAAFVIQFRPETDIQVGRFEGRVEHIPSSTSTRFHSLEELLAFIANILTEVSNAEKL